MWAVRIVYYFLYNNFSSDDDTVTDSASVSSSAPSIMPDDRPAGAAATDDNVAEELDVSASIGAGKEVMLSMSDVPEDISSSDAQQIVEMFSKELQESISGERE